MPRVSEQGSSHGQFGSGVQALGHHSIFSTSLAVWVPCNPGRGGGQPGLFSSIDRRRTHGLEGLCFAQGTQPPLLLPWEQWLLGGRTDGHPGDHFRESPEAQSLPPAQEAWREKEDWTHRLPESLFPLGSHKSHLPNWASSAGINTTRACLVFHWDLQCARKEKINHSFQLGRSSGARTSPAKPGNFPLLSRKGGGPR